ncbi:MAG: phosphoribosylformylglycinamidine synthase subunit PurL [Candidatus Eisenbacteria bacterium]|nr:phosphoribosylformylglycinamidine synthase subunit PurL [Candidatus Eisenbacteria bacterium]
MSLSETELLHLRSSLGREPLPAELLFFDALWSEHCSYKSSKRILEKFLPVKASNVVLGPGEDAGIVRLERGPNALCIAVSHESHNHPSQVLPFEGAATGIGGIVRDVYCMGAEVVGVMDCLRFGNPEGGFSGRVKEIASGVIDGIWQYGNALGVPNIGGDIYFDDSFDQNCVVNVVAVGVIRENEIIRSFVPDSARDDEYVLLLVGKPTDRTGAGGASFASRKLGAASSHEERVSVQVPDPFLKRVLALATKEVLELTRRKGVQIGMKDLGAGGIGCAFSEMGLAGGRGIEIDLNEVPLEEDMPPALVLCSETQERYVLAVPKGIAEEICRIYNSDFSLPLLYKGAQAKVIGKAVEKPVFVAKSSGKNVCDFPIALVKACPMKEIKDASMETPEKEALFEEPADIGRVLLRLASSPNLCSREYVYRFYDAEVQGRAVSRPGESDGCVFLPDPDLPYGVGVGVGGNPFYGEINPYWGGVSAVVEAMRNTVSAGALPCALTDCLNFGDPDDELTMWQFKETVRGMGEAAQGIGMIDKKGEPVPFVSGNVSFHNYTETGSIRPCPVVVCYGLIDDYSRALTLSLKERGDFLLLVGERKPELGGSAYLRELGVSGGRVPRVDFHLERTVFASILECMRQGLFVACHDISDGGLGLTLLEMCFPSRPRNLGISGDISSLSEQMRGDQLLFSESSGFVLELSERNLDRVVRHFEDAAVRASILGRVTSDGRIRIAFRGAKMLDIPVEEFFKPWKDRMKSVLS